MKITACQVNHLTNPVGFEMEKIVFHWVVEDAEGTCQEAARIRVWKETDDGREPAADTGWGHPDSLAAAVDLKLEPRTGYYWTVSVRSDANEEAVSEENYFETGKMEEPWTAQWIGCDEVPTEVDGGGAGANRHPVFFRDHILEQPAGNVASARLYICGLGLYEAYWNGERIGTE